jgi:8-oxo-dGTP diphosphatase
VERPLPVFGVRNADLPQKTRACAYAVIINGEGLVAGVREETDRLFLPGGGMELSESPAETVRREVLEELGCQVQIGERIGQALMYFQNDGCCQVLYATFYAGELGDVIAKTHEHELEWVSPEKFFHPHHTWAAQQRLAAKEHSETPA